MHRMVVIGGATNRCHWLDAQEEAEDRQAIREAKDEPTIPWEQVKAEIRAAEAAEGD